MDNRRRHRLFLVACLTLMAMAWARPGLGHEVLIVQSSATRAYQQAVDGFNQVYGVTTSLPGIASIQPTETILLDPESPDPARDVSRKYQDLQPNLIVAVGTSALEAVKGLAGPILYCLVPNPEGVVQGRPEVTGVWMATAPEAQLTAIKEALPAIKAIAFLHNPAAENDLFSLAQDAAGRLRLTLVDAPATNVLDAIRLLAKLAGQIDAILLPPDPVLINRDLLEALTALSLESRIPIIAFAPKYLEQGAALAIFTSPTQMGRQAAEMAKRFIPAPPPIGVRPEYGKETTIRTNDRIISILKIQLASQPQAPDRSPSP